MNRRGKIEKAIENLNESKRLFESALVDYFILKDEFDEQAIDEDISQIKDIVDGIGIDIEMTNRINININYELPF